MANLQHQLSKLKQRHRWILRAGALTICYAIWTSIFQLLILTFLTYLMMPSGPAGSAVLPRFDEITDSLSTNELPLLGLSSLIFVAFLRWLNPLTSTSTAEIINKSRLRQSWAPGLAEGFVLASTLIFALLLGGGYRLLGFYLEAQEALLALPGLLLRSLALLVFAYCEEFIFRHKILRHLRMAAPENSKPLDLFRFDLIAVAAASLCGLAVKEIQFDLSLMQLFTLFLLGISLGLRTLQTGDFARGAGLWGAMLILFQVLCSLPVLGTEFTGILLVKFQLTESLASNPTSANLIRFLSGGIGGPLASLALQLLLAVDIARGTLRYKKTLLQPRHDR